MITDKISYIFCCDFVLVLLINIRAEQEEKERHQLTELIESYGERMPF
jgi:hypothetical protein